MNRNEMIFQLQMGKHPINVSLQKWFDISAIPPINRLKARHQLDDGMDNCALCYIYKTCETCPLYIYYGVACDESITGINKTRNEKKYKRDFYAQYRETGNPQIVISALIKLKKRLWYIQLKILIKKFRSNFILFIKNIYNKLIRKKKGICKKEP